ncbi:UNVERIFIED_CONTAM: hypothetical protein FKN15_014505 [Acipenser sinensis]
MLMKYLCTAFFCVFRVFPILNHATGKEFTEHDMAHYRERIKSMFYHAYNSYLENAYPYDELRPLTCDGQDTWGSFSLTLIDALDTLLILGNKTEFQRVASVLQENINFDSDVNASVFETNIRVVGGLLSAHLLSKKAGMELEAGWPCSGPLLRMAEEAARKLLPGRGQQSINIRLSVMAVTRREYDKAIRNYTKYDDWYFWVQMHKGTVSMPVFQSLEAFWPGLQSLIGDLDSAMKTFLNYYTVWKQFGGLPEFYSIPQGYTVDKREGYPLRPELIESAMYLYRATADPTLLQLGRDVVESIEKISRVDCGFATVKDVRDHKLDNRMESFFLAETVKYLYLLFDPDNFLHNDGSHFDMVSGPYGDCVLGAGGYVFNTEAHPLDPAALHCCSRARAERWEIEEILSGEREPLKSQTSSTGEPHEQTERIVLQDRKKRKTPVLSCPSQPFSSKLSILGQIPEALLNERDKKAKWYGIPVLLQKLYESSDPNSDLLQTHVYLKEISSLLSKEAMTFVTEDRKTAQESTFPNTYTFDLFGGVHTEGVTKSLAARSDFVLFLFTLMTNKKTFLQTATLIEDILGVKKEMIQLDDIPNLSSLVQSFDQQQLANFCRILSVTISELDVGNDDKHTLLAKNAQQKKNSSPSQAEINQATVLNIPGFIERLCMLATRKVSENTRSSNFLQELEDWYTWLDNALVLDALMQMASVEAEHSSTESSDESSLATSPQRHYLPQSMKIVHEIMYKVEVLYVLCVLLMGRQRTQVHKMLAEFKLIPGINHLFDKLIWRKPTTNHVLHGQNQNCDCSPEISMKIQFLRLLQSFSDHHENKYLLLNNQELNELSAISMMADIPEVEAVVNTDRSLVCEGKRGLLTRLLSVMKKEPADSSFRFWQARAVESFLRGVTSYADQVFLLRRGLLEHILFCIIDSECKSRDVLQSYFDLLGELMKFNLLAFKRFNKYVDTEEKFQIFLSQINSSLVDSNMIVRCIALSLDRFESQTEDVKVVEVLSECRLLSYMARVENRLAFLFRLINIISVETLTQENVSCLNTSLVILMLARSKGKLSFYLNALREKEYAEKYPGCILNNFHNLLRFWQQHYLNKDKDRTSLENSACICFSYWKTTVSVLLSPDRTSPVAIASYIDEAYLDIDKDFMEE